MDPQSIARLGKMAGSAIIVIGFAIAIWSTIDLGYGDKDDKFRYFVSTTLTWLAWGGFVYLAAEIVDRLGSRSNQ